MKPFEQASEEELRALWEEKHGTPEIVPEDPLTEPLEIGEKYYTVIGDQATWFYWDGDDMDIFRLKDKLVFPLTPEGNAGAELRAKVHHPGIHWQEDVADLQKIFKVWEDAPAGYDILDGGLAIALRSFLKKYHTSNE